MRHFPLRVLMCLLVLCVPARADAWFGLLDKLSGPGPFKGVDLEFRLFCFRDEPTERTLGLPEDEADGAQPRLQADADARRRAKATGIGLHLSFCPAERARLASIDLGLTYWWTGHDGDWAGGERVRIFTVVPSISRRVFRNTAYDFLDVSTGGGVYWMSSRGFESFSGVILHPVRVDISGPSDWATRPRANLKRIASATILRGGIVVFPGGFEADAFNARPELAVPIPVEMVPMAAIFFDVIDFLRTP